MALPMSMERSLCLIMEDENYPSYGRFNFNISDVHSIWEEINDQITVIEEFSSTPWGSKKFTIRDLDGNELGIVRKLNNSWY